MTRGVEDIYSDAGFNGSIPIGEKIAVLVVDFQIGFTDPQQSPLAGESTEEVLNTVRILNCAREKNVPIIYTVVGYSSEVEGGLFIHKVPSLKKLKIGTPLTELDPRLERRSDEPIIIKKYPSAFFGTYLSSLLSAQKIDTLFITGTTTSGCIRASVVDAMQYGFAPYVIEDAVSDRASGPHESNLFDMKSKNAELINTSQAIAYLNEL
jgi:maleamate amidohydrolase